jgi:hypothetical protein
LENIHACHLALASTGEETKALISAGREFAKVRGINELLLI